MMLCDVMKVVDGILLVNDLFCIMSSPYLLLKSYCYVAHKI